MSALATKAGTQLAQWKRKVNWQYVKKALTFAFIALMLYLIVSKAIELDWQKIWETFTQTKGTTLVIATGIGLLSYTAYASYDLIGRYVLGVKVSARKTVLAAWISYACNLNFGAIVGSVALRYRLYSRLGVKAEEVTKILSISVFSNWTGYVLLAGILFVSGAFEPPESWAVGALGFRLLGGGFLALIAAYIGLCAFAPKREYSLRGHTLTLPRLPIVAWQFITAITHWSLMALVMYQFFAGDLDFTTVYLALLVSCIAGAVSHIPGGLGVIEAVFIALLAGQLPKHEIIASVFAYRCVFYFLPLAITVPLYIGFETLQRKKIS